MSGRLLKSTYIGESELPHDPGAPTGPEIHVGDVSPLTKTASWTLSGLADSFTLLQPALIRAAGLVSDPVSLYWLEHDLPRNEEPRLINLLWSAFDGIPAPECHTILACPKQHARGLVSYLARVRFGTPDTPVWDVVHQRLKLLDKKLLDSLTHKPATPPEVEIDVFGLVGSTQSLLWRPKSDPWTGGFRLMQVAPQLPKKPTRRPFSRGTS